VLDHIGIQFESDLVLMGSAQSLGRGNIEGLRFFLDNTDLEINAGLCVEGVELGRISYTSIGMMRCEITITIPEEYDWSRFGASGAIINMNRVVNRILSLPVPRQPQTSILIGAVEGGTSFNTIATTARIKFEIRSESEEMVTRLHDQIHNITDEVTALTDAEVRLNVLAQRKPGGIEYSHPLVAHARDILKKLGIKHRILPSTSELSAFIARSIPAITIGLTTGENMDKINETVKTGPVPLGIAQLVGLLQAIDQGCCDEAE
jgi:di/tripeptidase